VSAAWDFLDPFQAVESYLQDHPAASAASPAIHARSLSSDDIEEDEDIPELEDEESGVVVREAHAGEECTCVNSVSEEIMHETSSSDDELDSKSDGNSSCEEEPEGHIEFRSSDAISSIVDGVESVVEEQLNDPGIAEPPAAVPERMYNSDVEVVQEIKLQFDNASKSAGDVSKMLEVDKMPYNQKKNSGLKGWSITPSVVKKFSLYLFLVNVDMIEMETFYLTQLLLQCPQ